MTNLPALREAVAKYEAWKANEDACESDLLDLCETLDALPALLDELEAARAMTRHWESRYALLESKWDAARAELDLLHTQMTMCVRSRKRSGLLDYIKTMQDHKDMNPGDELIALRQSEKQAWDEAAQARVDGAENLMLLTQELQAELAAAQENDVRGMCIIEAAVRSPSISDYMNHWEGRCLKAEADLAALWGQTCATCRHRIPPLAEPMPATCGACSVPGHSVAVVMCKTLGDRCGAWTAKEQT